MRRECRERFPRHRLRRKPLVSDPGMHHVTCVTHVPWCMSGSLTRGGGENVPGIPGACAIHNFTYLARSPCSLHETVGTVGETDTHLCWILSEDYDQIKSQLGTCHHSSSRQLSCRGMCKIVVWYNHYNRYWSKRSIHRISIMNFNWATKWFATQMVSKAKVLCFLSGICLQDHPNWSNHCGLVTPYGDRNVDQNWLSQ